MPTAEVGVSVAVRKATLEDFSDPRHRQRGQRIDLVAAAASVHARGACLVIDGTTPTPSKASAACV